MNLVNYVKTVYNVSADEFTTFCDTSKEGLQEECNEFNKLEEEAIRNGFSGKFSAIVKGFKENGVQLPLGYGDLFDYLRDVSVGICD